MKGGKILTKRVLLLGWPRSGKTLFMIAITYIAEFENLGYAESIPDQYGFAIDEALAGRGADLNPTMEPKTLRLKLKGSSDIDFIEHPLTREDFKEYHVGIADEINNVHGVLFFIKPKFRAREGFSLGRQKGKLGKTIGGYAAFCIQIGCFGKLVRNALSKFKFWRKTRIIGFLMTKTMPYHFSTEGFERCIESEIPNLPELINKRGIEMYFDGMELVYPAKGIHRRGPREALNRIIDPFHN